MSLEDAGVAPLDLVRRGFTEIDRSGRIDRPVQVLDSSIATSENQLLLPWQRWEMRMRGDRQEVRRVNVDQAVFTAFGHVVRRGCPKSVRLFSHVAMRTHQHWGPKRIFRPPTSCPSVMVL